MDFVLETLDSFVLDDVYAYLLPATSNATVPLSPKNFHSEHLLNSTSASLQTSASAWPRDFIGRQALSLGVSTFIGIHILYFLFAYLSYRFIFNHDMMRHPRFLENQVRKEIQCSMQAFPGMIALTLPFFLMEVRGYTKLYNDPSEHGGIAFMALTVPLFLLFTDYGIYWIHRWLHLPVFYKHLHKPHHKWVIPTPFASHAFHPVDGWAQSLPYHFYVLLFPMQRHLYLVLFVFVNCWSILIHDSDMITGHPLEKVINGPAHHTLHHLYFVCNYGQYFTFADRAGGSYRHPLKELDPMLEVTALDSGEVKREEEGEWEKRVLGDGGRKKSE